MQRREETYPPRGGDRRLLLAILAAFVVLLVISATLWLFSGSGSERRSYAFRGGTKELIFPASYSPTVLKVPLPKGDVKRVRLRIEGVLPPNSTFIPVSLRPVSITSADFNGDGVGDVAVACYDSSVLEVLPGTGSGERPFFQPTSYPTGSFPVKVSSGDLDGDGDADLILLGESGWMELFLNDGSGHFSRQLQNVTAGKNPTDIISCDLDGDGKAEVLTVNEVGDTLRIFTLRGGELNLTLSLETDGDPQAVCAADMDSDGLTDILVANRADRDHTIWVGGESRRYFFTVSLFRSTGEGYERVGDYSVGRGPTDMVTLDVDGDGDEDVVVATRAGRSISLLINDGGALREGLGGSIDALQYYSSDPAQLMRGDFNLDGMDDVATVNPSNSSLELFFGSPGGGLIPSGIYYIGNSPETLTVMDIDGDKDEDVVVGNHNEPHEGDGFATLSTLRNLYYGVFHPVSYYTVGASPRGIYAADADGDGALDLGTANYFGSSVSVLYGNGVGEFSSPYFVPIGLEPYSVLLEDLNGDGLKDIASADEARNVVIVVMNQGNRSFAGDRPAYYVRGYPIALRAADLDGDGDVDLISVNNAQNATCILNNSGEGTFESTMVISLGDAMPFDVAVGDLNGDGLKDIVTANFGSEVFHGDNVSLLFRSPDGTYPTQKRLKVGVAPSSVRLSDVDSDGDLDILVVCMKSDEVYVFENDGSGEFTLREVIGTGALPQSLAVADINGDGREDLLVTCTSTNDLEVLLNTPEGFVSLYRTPAGSYPYMIAPGDFNSDGRVDVAYTCVNVNSVGVLTSLYYPTDLKVDVGYDLKVDYRWDGTLDGYVEVDLTEAFKEYLKENGGREVPLAVTSSMEGLVRVTVEVITA